MLKGYHYNESKNPPRLWTPGQSAYFCLDLDSNNDGCLIDFESLRKTAGAILWGAKMKSVIHVICGKHLSRRIT